MAVEMPHWSHTTKLEATPISASRARAFVSQHLAAHRLSRLDDPVRLVASELATNALIHAQTSFSVTLSAPDDRTVLLTVHDDSASLPERRTVQVMNSGGRGLDIVDLVSLDWGVDEIPSGSKTVWASFNAG
jgi:anti-sigma regulatory factor (Ser/Thr protein kinase)